MELKGSKTEKNLQAAFAGESQARNKYTYFASKAKKEGYVQIAAKFEMVGEIERHHEEHNHPQSYFQVLAQNDMWMPVEDNSLTISTM